LRLAFFLAAVPVLDGHIECIDARRTGAAPD